ncbi:MAG TPA: SDR family oxidoreductase [Candidatus Dormibacteraeota bacterium]|jgi:NAD(P)-dependent dehydrogenase (short-subunit alcohol dehydrogenase family)|nr:SDR family oxidoreductase [Candidatus Dormibacteraeota bacterium]
MRLAGSRCLITGCSSGIGRALALALAAEGASVIATARDLEAVRDLADRGMETLKLDVTDGVQVEAAVGAAAPVDVLINNAGYGLEGAVEEVSDEELLLQFQTNLFGPWRLCRAVLPAMRRRGSGAIVNISSFGGQVPYPGIGAYRSSKFALEGLSWTLHLEVEHFGIRVLDVQPGLVASEFGGSMRRAAAATPESAYAVMRAEADAVYPRMSPAERALAPDQVAAAVIAELARPSGPLRLRIGEDTRRVLGVASGGDDAYERFLTEELGFTWHPRSIDGR